VLTAIIEKGKSFLRAGKTPAFNFPAAAELYGFRPRHEWSRLGVPEIKSDRRIGVVVCPWLFTPAPFFMLETALQLRLAGYRVSVLWDAGNVFVDAAKPREIAAIEPLLADLPDSRELCDVRALPRAAKDPFGFVDELVF